MKQINSPRGAQRFLSPFSGISSHFRPAATAVRCRVASTDRQSWQSVFPLPAATVSTQLSQGHPCSTTASCSIPSNLARRLDRSRKWLRGFGEHEQHVHAYPYVRCSASPLAIPGSITLLVFGSRIISGRVLKRIQFFGLIAHIPARHRSSLPNSRPHYAEFILRLCPRLYDRKPPSLR
jgi:hypothetical protein